MRRIVTALAAAGLCAGLCATLGGVALWPGRAGGAPPVAGPETVTVPPGSWAWRPSGDWRRAGREVDPALVRLASDRPLRIMRHQVSRGDYAACVAAGSCPAVDGGAGDPGLPQTAISWHDATAYAAWLSAATGAIWRLPTDAEWQRAAAERFADDAVGESADPAARWVAAYAREVELRGEADATLRPRGGWGENSLGVADLAGNVWEWTDECVANVLLDPDGAVARREAFCGARIAEGRHRATIIDFVRDARSGGCGAGVPPDYLGVRLVRED